MDALGQALLYMRDVWAGGWPLIFASAAATLAGVIAARYSNFVGGAAAFVGTLLVLVPVFDLHLRRFAGDYSGAVVFGVMLVLLFYATRGVTAPQGGIKR